MLYPVPNIYNFGNMGKENIHIISIGGSVMHDLAITLKKNGNIVTGSDDIIYDFVKNIPKSIKVIIIENANNPKLKKNLERKYRNIKVFLKKVADVSNNREISEMNELKAILREGLKGFFNLT